MMDDSSLRAVDDDFVVVGVGASAGGFEALIRMFSGVPAGAPAAFVVIQHLDPDHDSIMADLLNRKTDLDVRQASHGEDMMPGNIYLIPPGTGLRTHDNKLYLVPFAEPRGVRRPIDDFFFSLAEAGNHNCAAVVLSGTGADGSMGLQAIKEMGGITIAQNPEEAKYDGMPRAGIHTGAVDRVLDAEQIVPTILTILAPEKKRVGDAISDINAHLIEICHLIRERTGHDFSGYKRPTLVRRIERRMQLLGIYSPMQYVHHLQETSDEADALFRDLLINVTRFFRDVGNFEVLARRAIDPLIASAASGEAVRIWVPGCSTGEEAYTIAMICAYAAERYNVSPHLQIFATDIDEAALAHARLGRYPIGSLQDIPEPYRARYVDISSKDIQISPRLRDMIRFSSHNLIRDPAFSRMDLISCRNLFIYFNDKTQRTVLPLLHFSLKPSGYLFLGPSESVGEHEGLFASIDRQARVFRKRDVPASYPVEFVSNGLSSRPIRETRHIDTGSYPSATTIADVSTRRILEAYAPATVTINERGEIVGSSGRLARYFEFSGHQGRELVISVARRGLRDVLGPLLRAAQVERVRVLRNNVEVVSEFGVQIVDLIADPLTDGHTLIIFNQKNDFEPVARVLEDTAPEGGDRLHYLEEELQQTQLRLRSTIEELETANEELKSSNEEMMSMNEELQSSNEELTTANDELKIKIDQLDVLNNDLRNFFESADLGVLILDANLAIRAFTPRVRSLFPLREADKGRALSEISGAIPSEIYTQSCYDILAGSASIERLLTVEETGAAYLMRIMPYLGFSGQIDGLTMTFLDVSELKESEEKLFREQQRLKLALGVGHAGVFELDRAQRLILLDAQSLKLVGLGEGDHDDNNVTYERFLDCVAPEQRDEVDSHFQRIFNMEPLSINLTLKTADTSQERWLRILSNVGDHAIALVQDVTEQHKSAQRYQILLREMNHRIKNVFAVISSIIRMSGKSYETVPEFSQATLARISALARANMVTQAVDQQVVVSLEFLLESLFEPYDVSNLMMAGPEVFLSPSDASALSLVLHEWATNACKYGAFSCEEGRLELHWSKADDTICIDWRETMPAGALAHLGAGSQVSGGFGSKLVTMASKQLAGNVEMYLEPTGFVGRISMPTEHSEER